MAHTATVISLERTCKEEHQGDVTVHMVLHAHTKGTGKSSEVEMRVIGLGSKFAGDVVG